MHIIVVMISGNLLILARFVYFDGGEDRFVQIKQKFSVTMNVTISNL